MKFLKFFLKFIKKEVSWFQGACAEMADRALLLWRDQQIDALNLRREILEEGERDGLGIDPKEKTDVSLKIDRLSDSYNEIRGRIRARDAQREQVAAH
jgi:hypothetical protein